ncbi:hypothetical protein yinte0001_34240 [Yersinia intermedia ATCC 29909]|nr:hypothetical protein yinte0001_34240 [Yersinia intermedia ATCC 29909]
MFVLVIFQLAGALAAFVTRPQLICLLLAACLNFEINYV